MKYVLILYVCSFINVGNPPCFESYIVPVEFENYTDCILQGYQSSHNLLITNYSDRIEDEKLSIKFYCQGVKVGENI